MLVEKNLNILKMHQKSLYTCNFLGENAYTVVIFRPNPVLLHLYLHT